MPIYITGSLAYDRIMELNGRFSDHILPDKIHMLNVCFLTESITERKGGTAGNIAYTLSLMQEKPKIISSLGKDGAPYKIFLDSLNLPTDAIQNVENTLSAGAYIATDIDSNQITYFHPAAMNTPSNYALPPKEENDWGIVSPTNTEDMQKFPKKFKEQGIPYIFDPGQQIPALSAEALLLSIQGSELLITNAYEFELICSKTKKTLAELRELTNGIITTQGEQGATLYLDKTIHAPAVKIDHTVDPTGAGDAFRAGILKGLKHTLSTLESVYLGSTAASFCVEHLGTQEHTFTYENFAQRYIQTYTNQVPISW